LTAFSATGLRLWTSINDLVLLFYRCENFAATFDWLVSGHESCFCQTVGGWTLSTKGIYTALSGAKAQSLRLDTIANNLANVNTTGFKKDQQVFKEYLTSNEKDPEVMKVPRIPASVESFYDMQGGDKSFVDTAGTYTDFSQGSIKSTGNNLDIALDGKGFFEIDTPQGLRLTRNGSLKVDSNGLLVNSQGMPILKTAPEGTAPNERVIQVSNKQNIQIQDNGDIYDGQTLIARISVIDVVNKESLHKIGTSNYAFKPNFRPEVVNVATPSIKQGFLEGSNVNVVQEMTDMIATTRMFDSTQQAIKAYDSMNDKLINVIGSVK
jgi:flagellar basal-body rod protein FlgF